ncbi:MAG TPA: hypothetical protein PKV66_03590, partial [Candidatus Pelethenecus sp.]|nr:hypothetical protein [Candidatus Pelethenecus sp.]
SNDPIEIPFFMKKLVDKAVEIYTSCDRMDLEELIRYARKSDNLYCFLRLLQVKPKYEEDKYFLFHHHLPKILCNMDLRITDYFDIKIEFAVYIFILELLKEKWVEIINLQDILDHEIFKKPINKYCLTKLENVTFLRQGFCIDDTYYLYNLFIDSSIGNATDNLPYLFKIMSNEIKDLNLYIRCDEKLAVPFSQKFETASLDYQKYYGPNIDFANINSILQKTITVHFHQTLLHKIVVIIKPDVENEEEFYHIEIEELWNTDDINDSYILANFIHSKYFPHKNIFTHIDFSVNQYDSKTYKEKYIGSVNDTKIPVDKYGDIHYKVWCVESNEISIETWSKIICLTLDEPFRDIFLEIFNAKKNCSND